MFEDHLVCYVTHYGIQVKLDTALPTTNIYTSTIDTLYTVYILRCYRSKCSDIIYFECFVFLFTSTKSTLQAYSQPHKTQLPDPILKEKKNTSKKRKVKKRC